MMMMMMMKYRRKSLWIWAILFPSPSLSVSSGVPNTEKQMKARGHRPSAFIVSRCLEPLMKHEAQVFDMTSQSNTMQ